MDAALPPSAHARSKLLRVYLVIEPGLRPIRFKSGRNTARKKSHPLDDSFFLAGPTGFEPAISSVTGRRVRPATPRAPTNNL